MGIIRDEDSIPWPPPNPATPAAPFDYMGQSVCYGVGLMTTPQPTGPDIWRPVEPFRPDPPWTSPYRRPPADTTDPIPTEQDLDAWMETIKAARAVRERGLAEMDRSALRLRPAPNTSADVDLVYLVVRFFEIDCEGDLDFVGAECADVRDGLGCVPMRFFGDTASGL